MLWYDIAIFALYSLLAIWFQQYQRILVSGSYLGSEGQGSVFNSIAMPKDPRITDSRIEEFFRGEPYEVLGDRRDGIGKKKILEILAMSSQNGLMYGLWTVYYFLLLFDTCPSDIFFVHNTLLFNISSFKTFLYLHSSRLKMLP